VNMPPMEAGDVLSKLVRELTQLQADFRAFRSSSGTLASATITKGGLRLIEGGSIILEDGGGLLATDGGFITTIGGNITATDGDTGAVLAYFGKLTGGSYRSGLLTSTAAGDPFFWVAEMVDDSRTLYFEGKTARVDAADNIILNTPSLRLYGLPTTGSAANVRLETTGGTPVVQYVTSSLRYKDDPAPAVVDPAEVLQMQGRTWVDKGTVDRLGEAGDEVDIPRNVGFIAEELDALPSLRQFVDYDDEGRPDAIQYDRLTVALIELAKTQQKQLDRLAARLDAIDGGAPSSDEPQE
jgi:hypothetical protein